MLAKPPVRPTPLAAPRRRWILGALAVSTMLLVPAAGCGDDGSPQPSAAGTVADEAATFARCLTERDVPAEVARPARDGHPAQVTVAPSVPRAELVAAQRACTSRASAPADVAPDAAALPIAEERRLERGFARFARCMRRKGIDMPDPQVKGPGVVLPEGGDFNPASSAFRAAQRGCAQHMPEPPKRPTP